MSTGNASSYFALIPLMDDFVILQSLMSVYDEIIVSQLNFLKLLFMNCLLKCGRNFMIFLGICIWED